MLDPTVCMYVHVWCACCVVADARVGDTYLCGAVAGYTETGRVCMCATDGTGSHSPRMRAARKLAPRHCPPTYVGVSVPRGGRVRGSCCDCKE